jgi:hypothetical protein
VSPHNANDSENPELFIIIFIPVIITSKKKKKYCCIHIIIQTLVPYCIMHNGKLGGQIVITGFNHYWILRGSITRSIFSNFINFHNIEVPLYFKVLCPLSFHWFCSLLLVIIIPVLQVYLIMPLSCVIGSTHQPGSLMSFTSGLAL